MKNIIPWQLLKCVTNSYVATFHFFRSKVETIQRPSKSVNRNSLLYSTSIYRHPRYIPTNFGIQAVALYRERAVPVFIMADALGFRFTLVCLLSHSNMCTDRSIDSNVCIWCQWRTQDFCSGGGFNKFSWGQREGDMGAVAPSQGFWRQLEFGTVSSTTVQNTYQQENTGVT